MFKNLLAVFGGATLFLILLCAFAGFFVPGMRRQARIDAGLPPDGIVEPKSTIAQKPKADRRWYEGGNLMGGTAIDWQQATDENKLASCANAFFALAESDALLPAFATEAKYPGEDRVNVRKHCEALRDWLDEQFKPLPDPADNRKHYATHKVSTTAAFGAFALGWTNPVE